MQQILSIKFWNKYLTHFVTKGEDETVSKGLRFAVTINAEKVYTQFCVYLYLCQRKCNHMYAINHAYISFIYKECKYTSYILNN